MRRPFFILVGVFALALTVLVGSFIASRRLCERRMVDATDDLGWLISEFKLNTEAMAQVRRLHAGYLPKCADMCARIAAKKHELESALAGTTNISAEAEQKLTELGELRAKCQAQMLQHFVEVSQAMPPEQGHRYLAEMQRLTLGFHEGIEQSMSDHMGHEHPHD